MVRRHTQFSRTRGGRDKVLFRDVCDGLKPGTPEKLGWVKVRYSCTQAVSEGYDYVWIDTCYIDKSSSAELSEAINSMFSWYQNAAICYAYLADVDWDTELPPVIEYKSCGSCNQDLDSVLSTPLSVRGIAQRMSWAATRETTREEDRVYSLLGLFGVNMPLLYGEGPRAFLRLQEESIKSLKRSNHPRVRKPLLLCLG